MFLPDSDNIHSQSPSFFGCLSYAPPPNSLTLPHDGTHQHKLQTSIQSKAWVGWWGFGGGVV